MKSLNNSTGIGHKRLSNISKLRAQEVYYNNITSGLTGTNVQEAIDEIVSGGGGGVPQATPLVDGRIYGYSREVVGENTTVLGYNSIPTPVGPSNRIVIGKNSFPDLVDNGSGALVSIGNNICEIGSTAGIACHIIGHNNCLNGCGGFNTIIGNSNLNNAFFPNNLIAQNIIIGTNCLKDNNNPILENNFIIGNNNFTVPGPDPSPQCQNNLIFGKNITYANSSTNIGNIEIGSNIETNTNNSIIIHPSVSTTYNSPNNGVFYLGRDNIANWPNANNQFIIDNGYTDYKIFGVTGPFVGSGIRILHYDETTGRVNYASPENASVAHSKVLKLSPTNDLLFRTIRGDTGITVVEETDSIAIYGSGVTGPTGSIGATGPTGATGPINNFPMEPTQRGVAYGITSDTDSVVSLGYRTLNTYNTNPLGAVNQCIGSLTLENLDPSVTSLQNNSIISDGFFNNIGSITSMNGNCVIGAHQMSSNLINNFNNNILVGGGDGDVTFANLNAYTDVINNIALTTSDITYSAVNMNLGSVCIGTNSIQNMDVRDIVITSGAVVDVNSNQGSIILACGPTPISLGPYSGCFVVGNGLGLINPNASNQFSLNHSTIKAENLSNSTPSGNGQQHLFFDTATFQIRRANTANTAMSRVYRATGTTNASGQVSFNLTGLSLTTNPIVTATVQDASTTVGYLAQINALSTTNVTIQVMQSTTVVLAAQSMIATGSGRIVHINVAY